MPGLLPDRSVGCSRPIGRTLVHASAPRPQREEILDVADAGNLYFGDVLEGGVFRRAPDGDITTVIPKRHGVGGIAIHAEGGLVVSGPTCATPGRRDEDLPCSRATTSPASMICPSFANQCQPDAGHAVHVPI